MKSLRKSYASLKGIKGSPKEINSSGKEIEGFDTKIKGILDVFCMFYDRNQRIP